MNRQSLPVNLSFAGKVASAGPDLRLTLEAEPAAGTAEVGLADIAAMISRARSGLSARTVQEERCECVRITAEGTLILTLAVLVWPSRPGMTYTLKLPDIASALPVETYTRVRKWRYWTGGQNSLALPWMLEHARIEWMPGFPVVDQFSFPLSVRPAIRHEHADIALDSTESLYGVLDVQGAAVGYRHPFSLAFAKFDEETGQALRIELDDLPVEAFWRNAQGEPQSSAITIPIPDCAKDLLEACDDGRAVFRSRVRVQHNPYTWEIAYSVCDGRVLGSRRRKNGQ